MPDALSDENFRLAFAALIGAALLHPAAASAQTPQSRFAEVKGVKLHYLIAGKGDPILLLHGYAETSRMWAAADRETPGNHTVIAPDLRGFGQSAAPPDGYTKKAMAQDIHALTSSSALPRSALSAMISG
jgi:pimeloyl-ACP methyl ester carboxylesterase